ncbi:5-oxoprolinase [Rhodotorula toruloides]|uniref:5-oxoprolinase n=1 Tax=Rhodotorula toruloides TaxID=5286 RepID=A0A2T0A2F7_RHOTO|nr:5-oxoprolinase [Rhodotorula toruloides]
MPSILPAYSLPDHSVQVSTDRGGTFTDVHASWPQENGERKEIIFKLLSVDPSHYADAPTEACRRVLELATGTKIPRGVKLETNKFDYIRLSTTVATNALLERKGAPHVFVTTKGFRDLLRIGNQSRPNIFALNVRRAEVLYESVLEVDERVTLHGYTYDPDFEENAPKFDEAGKLISDHKGEFVRGISGEAVQILRKPDLAKVRSDLQAIYDRDVRSVAICFVHSFTFPDHENLVADICRDIGFPQISVSSALSPQIKAVPRATSASVDAYLNPVLKDYLRGFFKNFESSLADGTSGARVEFMTSEGTLVDVAHFSGLRSILSGPAGGVVGYSLTSWDEKESGNRPICGYDMGGTSTDVSRFDGRFEKTYETTTAGVSIQCPQLDINTVAAGGGSCLTFRNGLFRTGPESAGAHPGPACYRKGGPLAITDANLVLGRLFPQYFPHIFGPSEDQPLSREDSVKAFEELMREINAYNVKHGDGKVMTLDEVAYGFIKVANETMARPVRALTEAKGLSTSKHILAAFGGAGGQHACELARTLGISTILIHRYSSILSAYGMALSNRAFEKQEPCAAEYNDANKPALLDRIERLRTQVVEELRRQGFAEHRIDVECYLNMRYDGSDTSLMTLAPADGSFDYQSAFEAMYRAEFGFLIEGKAVMVDDVRVRGIGRTFDSLGESVHAEVRKTTFSSAGVDAKAEKSRTSMYFEQTGRVDVPVYLLDNLATGDLVEGPSAIVDGTATLILDPGASAKICSRHVYITLA